MHLAAAPEDDESEYPPRCIVKPPCIRVLYCETAECGACVCVYNRGPASETATCVLYCETAPSVELVCVCVKPLSCVSIMRHWSMKSACALVNPSRVFVSAFAPAAGG